MNTREIAKEYRLSHWARIMQDRVESGLSIEAFCKTAGFHPNVYFYWQRKLREATCQDLRPAQDKKVIPHGWAVCLPTKPGSKESSVSIEIGKFRVVAGHESDVDQLEKIFRVLASLC